MQQEGAALAQSLSKAVKKRRAFESQGAARAADMAYAADYTDEWYRLPGNRGSFRTFYLCGRKWGQERCHTLTVSSLWSRLHQDPIATKQRWYCPVCMAKYKTSNGVMVELMCNGETSYVKAPFPPDDIKDLKAMAVEKQHAGINTVEELLQAIPEAHPVGAEWLTPTCFEGTYSYQEAVFDEVPMLDWNRIYSIAG